MYMLGRPQATSLPRMRTCRNYFFQQRLCKLCRRKSQCCGSGSRHKGPDWAIVKVIFMCTIQLFLCKLLSRLLKNSSAPVLGSSCNSTVIKFQFFKFHFNSITLASKALRKVKSKIQKKMFQLKRAWFRAAQASTQQDIL